MLQPASIKAGYNNGWVCVRPWNNWGVSKPDKDVATLEGHAMRLSNFVLKREWERLKWTK
ncbi:hypothetical protein GCM10011404_34080 [Sphingomonas prati]|nr:hypothetical protein GCM10011404_34080 [Sphingomonas prati]